ncbi:MAG: hypothetical protein ACLTSD_09260 [Eubacterium sp.]
MERMNLHLFLKCLNPIVALNLALENETGINGIQRSSIYYCDPMRSGQKGTTSSAYHAPYDIAQRNILGISISQCQSYCELYKPTPRESCGQTPYDAALKTLEKMS